MSSKKYLNISEVAKMLDLKEHVIRYWDSIDPKTQKLRVEGISTKTKGGTRYFSRDNIAKLEKLKKLLYTNGYQNYSLNLANNILEKNTNLKQSENKTKFQGKLETTENEQKINQILQKMRILLKN